jgi:hypothetical protein
MDSGREVIPRWLRILLLRSSTDMTIPEIAKRLELSASYVRHVIRGEALPKGFRLNGVKSNKVEEKLDGSEEDRKCRI